MVAAEFGPLTRTATADLTVVLLLLDVPDARFILELTDSYASCVPVETLRLVQVSLGAVFTEFNSAMAYTAHGRETED